MASKVHGTIDHNKSSLVEYHFVKELNKEEIKEDPCFNISYCEVSSFEGIPWKLYKTPDWWVGNSTVLKITAQGKTKEELIEAIKDTHRVLFENLYEEEDTRAYYEGIDRRFIWHWMCHLETVGYFPVSVIENVSDKYEAIEAIFSRDNYNKENKYMGITFESRFNEVVKRRWHPFFMFNKNLPVRIDY